MWRTTLRRKFKAGTRARYAGAGIFVAAGLMLLSIGAGAVVPKCVSSDQLSVPGSVDSEHRESKGFCEGGLRGTDFINVGCVGDDPVNC